MIIKIALEKERELISGILVKNGYTVRLVTVPQKKGGAKVVKALEAWEEPKAPRSEVFREENSEVK